MLGKQTGIAKDHKKFPRISSSLLPMLCLIPFIKSLHYPSQIETERVALAPAVGLMKGFKCLTSRRTDILLAFCVREYKL